MIPKNRRKMEPDICAVLDKIADSIKTEINCISIGTIVTFYPDTQTADVKLNYKRVSLFVDPSIDKRSDVTEYPTLVNCPVVVFSGGGGYITLPINAGDSCLLLFNDRELDTWYTNGGTNPPASARVHDLNDGIALVGIRNALNPISGYYTSGIKIFYGGGYITLDNAGNIVVQGTTVNINP